MSHKAGRIDGNARDSVWGGAGSGFIWAGVNGGTSLMDLFHLSCSVAAASFRWEDEGRRLRTSRRINDPPGSCTAFRIRPAADWQQYKDETLLCDVVMTAVLMLWLQVANLKKESEFHWYKEDTEIIPDVKPDLGAGVCKLPIKLVIEPSHTNIYCEHLHHCAEGLWWVKHEWNVLFASFSFHWRQQEFIRQLSVMREEKIWAKSTSLEKVSAWMAKLNNKEYIQGPWPYGLK